MKYSAIILLEEKNEDFTEFVQMLHETFSAGQDSFEIIIMANGLEGFLKNELEKMRHLDSRLKAFALNKKTSQAVCLKAALKESRGEIIVVCGSYQQITQDSFLKLLGSLDPNTDILSPWRQKRVDPSFNQFQSKVFNLLVKLITRSNIHDLSCTVKVFRREVLEETELYGNMYRFLSILAEKNGFRNKEIKSEHYQERGKTGFYGFFEYLERIIDIFTLYFNVRFTRKPLRFFSTLGASFFIIGLAVIIYIFCQKLFMGVDIGDRPALIVSILFMVLGAQAASVGLLGEIIAFTHGRNRRAYIIEKEI
jgi:hypothetical protein